VDEHRKVVSLGIYFIHGEVLKTIIAVCDGTERFDVAYAAAGGG
jgi:hypothetical protein